jgi:hypothetical protein
MMVSICCCSRGDDVLGASMSVGRRSVVDEICVGQKRVSRVEGVQGLKGGLGRYILRSGMTMSICCSSMGGDVLSVQMSIGSTLFF